MVVVFEFLDTDPMENVITCMNFKVNKVIFLGYSEVIDDQRSSTERFLKKYCGVQQVVFLPLSHSDLNAITKVLRGEIQRELANENDVYFDITGGENLLLVAFGSVGMEYDVSMHMYDVPTNELIILKQGKKGLISENVPTKTVPLNIDRYITLHGGIINYRMHKDIKGNSEDLLDHVDDLWTVFQKYGEIWNPFSSLCRNCFIPDDTLTVTVSVQVVSAALHSYKTIKTHNCLINILKDLDIAGAIGNFECDNGTYSFRYFSEEVKECLWEGGSILELYSYRQFARTSDYCKAGVHIDWDGVIRGAGKDVLNEVDVLALTGNIPTFVSCKSGKMGPDQTLHALYELQTVASKFGGKYAKKVLMSAQPLPGNIYLERAEEMGIEVNILCDIK